MLAPISARARERYKVAAVKDDRFDAFVLADTLRHEHRHWRPLALPSPVLAEIKALTRDRDRLLETQQATESQLRMILEAYHPAPARLFSSVDRSDNLVLRARLPDPGGRFTGQDHQDGGVPDPPPLHRSGAGPGAGRGDARELAIRLTRHGGR